MIKIPNLNRLQKALIYDPNTGLFTRYGRVLKAINSDGYLTIKFEGTVYKGHQLAWYMYYGVWPSQMIDHKNKIRHENWINNLREATNKQNLANSVKRSKNSKGWRGVTPWRNKFRVYIQLDGKKVYLGLYSTVVAANLAYEAVHKMHYGEYSCL